MRNLRLTGPRLDTAAAVVDWLGAVQAQDYGPARWSIGQRTIATTDALVERAFADGELVRTHVLRPTWHFTLPTDIRWLLQLTGPRVQATNGHMYRASELDSGELTRASKAVARALEGGNQLTRSELQAVLAGAGVVAPGFRLAYILMHAELTGLICSGAPRGKQHTYALLDERVAPTAPLTRDEALARLTRRYFTSHGPATVKDFHWWSSLTLADIKHGLAVVGADLDHVEIDGRTYWFGIPPPTDSPGPPTVRLLQAYDEYTVGFSESKYVLDASGLARARAGPRPLFNLVIVLDTQVVGQWRRTVDQRTVRIDAVVYRALDADQLAALDGAVQQHAEFLGRTGVLDYRVL